MDRNNGPVRTGSTIRMPQLSVCCVSIAVLDRLFLFSVHLYGFQALTHVILGEGSTRKIFWTPGVQVHKKVNNHCTKATYKFIAPALLLPCTPLTPSPQPQHIQQAIENTERFHCFCLFSTSPLLHTINNKSCLVAIYTCSDIFV